MGVIRTFMPTLVSLSLIMQAQDDPQTRTPDVFSTAKETALGAQLAGRVRGQSTSQDAGSLDGSRRGKQMIRRIAWHTKRSCSHHKNAYVPVAFSAVQRRFELEADRVAVRAMSGAGFDADSLLSYIERNQIDRAPDNLSQIPPLSVHIRNLEQAIGDRSANGPYIISTDLFQSIQEEVRHEMLKIATSNEARTVPSLIA